MVFQSYALYPHMTVDKNIGFALKIRGDSKAEIERQGRRGRRRSWASSEYLDRKPGRSRAASASASPWAGRSCETRRPS